LSASRSRGFTLIELLVVVLILAFLTTTLSLTLERFDRQAFNETVKQLNIWLVDLRSRASQFNQAYGVDVRPDSLFVVYWDDGEWVPRPQVRPFLLDGEAAFKLQNSSLKNRTDPVLFVDSTGKIIASEKLILFQGDEILEVATNGSIE